MRFLNDVLTLADLASWAHWLLTNTPHLVAFLTLPAVQFILIVAFLFIAAGAYKRWLFQQH